MNRMLKWLRGQINPKWSHCVLFEADSLPRIDLDGLNIEEVKPGDKLTKEQKNYLLRDITFLRLWRLMRYQKYDRGSIFFARLKGEICHYTFLNPGATYKKMFPKIKCNSWMIGPCMTSAEFRGRRIYPKVISHVVNSPNSEGSMKFYIYTHSSNGSSLKGIEKTGFTPCGQFKTKRYLLGLHYVSCQIDEEKLDLSL